MAVPAGLPARSTARAQIQQVQPTQTPRAAAPDRAYPSEDCLATTICSLKGRVRWRTAAWAPDFCRTVAHQVLLSAKQNDISPSLLVAVMINESDMNENAFLVSEKNGAVYAKDSGLMGIRCVLDAKDRCTNGSVRGMPWKKLMDPLTNIAIGARELAKWRAAGVTRVRDRKGHEKFVTCQHKTHGFWAHYNHGPIYIDHGPARHYPHRIAVLGYALARALNTEAPELKEPEKVTMRDPGRRARTPDRPMEPRYRKLCDQIRSVGGMCAGVASLDTRSPKLN